MRNTNISFFDIFALLSFFAICIVAWATHIIWIIASLSSDAWTWGHIALGAIGAFMPPVGVVHGFMIWFGYGF